MQAIIVIGMHRSGTSLLVKILQELGVFMGMDLEHNSESKFFIEVNEWMLNQAGASWDNPENFNYIPGDFKATMVDIIDGRIKSSKRRKYLGRHNSSKYRSIKDLDFSWGWKDPRNTFTYDIWKEIFPQAKIIHIHRNPVDVVSSLMKREEALASTFAGNPLYRRVKKLVFAQKLPSHRILYHPFRCVDAHGTFELWKEYVAKALEVTSGKNVESLQLSFEGLLEMPETAIKQIADFCSLKTETNHQDFISRLIDGSRKYAFVNDEKLVTFYNQIKNDEQVLALGYGNILKERA